MNKVKKILIRGGIGAGAFIALLAILVLIASRIWDIDTLGRNAAASMESLYHVHSQRTKISLFPYPKISFYGISFQLSDNISVSSDSLTIYPSLSRLFRSGKFSPSKIEVMVPRVSMKPPSPGSVPDAPQPEVSGQTLPSRLAWLRERISHLHAVAYAAVPDVVISVDDAVLEFYTDKDRVFRFQEIDVRASVHENSVEVELTGGKSNLWDAIAFTGWVYPKEWKSSGELKLTRGTPTDFLSYCFPASANRFGDAEVNLTLSFSSNGPSNTKADLSATIPKFILGNETGITAIQNGSLTGSFSVDNTRLECTIAALRLDSPRITLSGRFVKNYADQTVALNVDSQDMDATAVREAALTVGRDSRVIQRIFDIVRGGNIPHITFDSQARDASDLGEFENFTIRGSLEQGTIFAPKAELLVTNVRGDVVIVDGMLDGTSLSGKTAGTSTWDGTLKVGLRTVDKTFHLDLPLDADLSELPPVLDRVVKNDALKKEFARMRDVQGRTVGRMTLGEDLDDVNVRVETGPFRMTGRYDRFEEPLDLEGASFLLDGPRLIVGKLNAKTGKNSFKQVDLSFDWSSGTKLEFTSSATSLVTFALINPLIERQESWKKILSGDAAIKGDLIVDSITFKGNISDNSKWVFKAEGAFDDVIFQTRFLAGPVHLKSGSFDMTRDTLKLKQVGTALSDSSLQLSGTLTGWFDNLRTADLSISGRLGPEGNKTIALLTGLPTTFRAIPNLTLNQSRMVWEKDTKTTFNGEIQLSSGPRINLNLSDTPDELAVEELKIEDADSDAVISLIYRDRDYHIDFSGSLSNKTVDKLLVENKFLTGPMQGKFSAVFDMDNPRKSTARGQLRLSGFQLPANLRVPALIEDAVLDADGNKVDVQSANISWDGSSLRMGGTITVAEDAYIVDMSATARNLNMESILNAKKEKQPEAAPQGEEPPGEEHRKKVWDAPVRGRIQVKSEHLSYEKLTWSPANATVVFSPGFFEIDVDQANLCGVSTPGKISITPSGMKIALAPEAKNADLEPAVLCFFDKQHLATGKFDLKGKISGSNGNGKLVESLQGDLDFKAKDGRIYRFQSFAKIISLLSITEIYRGQLPDLFSEGCAFDTIQAMGKIKDGKLVLSESAMDGPSVKMVFRGDIDLARKRVDITALVTPIRTVDRILGVVPLVGKLLDGVFISVPVRIVGDVSDPEVIPMSPTAVGEELFGFMKRTFKLPFTLLQPLAEGANKAGKETRQAPAQ